MESAEDPRVQDYTRLRDGVLRRVRESQHGLYIAESSTVLRRALAAGHRPRSFFMAEKWLSALSDVFAAHPDTPVFYGDDAVIERITGFHLHRGALAAMERPQPKPFTDVIANVRRIAVLEDIVDHSNLGAIFRSAAALGIEAVLLSPRCADPLYRRSIRVSMGTVFQVPWARLESWPAGIEALKDSGFLVVGMTLGEKAIPLDDFIGEECQKLAVVLGTEGQGLTSEVIRRLDRQVTVPMSGEVDSLNVAAASAVVFWALQYANRDRHGAER